MLAIRMHPTLKHVLAVFYEQVQMLRGVPSRMFRKRQTFVPIRD